MKRLFSIILGLALLTANSHCQFSRQNQDSIRKLTKQDHQEMMKKLGITSLRPELKKVFWMGMLPSGSTQAAILPGCVWG